MSLRLPRCQSCGAVQFPLRGLCGNCLEDALRWTDVDAGGSVLSWTRLHVSQEAFFNEHAPLTIGLIKLDCGPVVFAHLAQASAATGRPVGVELRRDKSERDVFVALPRDSGKDALKEFSHLLKEASDVRT